MKHLNLLHKTTILILAFITFSFIPFEKEKGPITKKDNSEAFRFDGHIEIYFHCNVSSSEKAAYMRHFNLSDPNLYHFTSINPQPYEVFHVSDLSMVTEIVNDHSVYICIGGGDDTNKTDELDNDLGGKGADLYTNPAIVGLINSNLYNYMSIVRGIKIVRYD